MLAMEVEVLEREVAESAPLQLSSDEKTRISRISLHMEMMHRVGWKKICDPPSGDLRSRNS